MKRGQTDLSLLVGIRKPSNISSHDVVNRCRSIFQEKRIGHTGTLDPLASGVLPICIGPATRLDAFMVRHDKEYIASIRFGWETSTDDCEGDSTRSASVAPYLFDPDYAKSAFAALVGEHEQMPPLYSAIKIDGKPAYKAARAGRAAKLTPRTVHILEAELLGISTDDAGNLIWTGRVAVSKGTYIRSLARDLGRSVSSAAHLVSLERTRAGRISLEQCVSLETLESLKGDAALDPVRVLGMRYAFADNVSTKAENGVWLDEDAIELCEPLEAQPSDAMCTCASSVAKSTRPPDDGEHIAVIVANRLKAIYEYDAARGRYRSSCVFSIGVKRF